MPELDNHFSCSNWITDCLDRPNEPQHKVVGTKHCHCSRGQHKPCVGTHVDACALN